MPKELKNMGGFIKMKKVLLVMFLAVVMMVSSVSAAFAAIDPYGKVSVDARSDMALGLQIAEGHTPDGANVIGWTQPGTWVKFSDMDFGSKGAVKVAVEMSAHDNGLVENKGTVEFRLDGLEGTLISTVSFTRTGSWTNYKLFEAVVNGATGVHDLYIVFQGKPNLSYVQFTAEDSPVSAHESNPETGDNGIIPYVILAAGAGVVLLAMRKKRASQS
jgi:hypothetical protein